ncbi:carboxymethylenebutenolidase [Cupriavidus necator]|uniref:Carboxymethylenebutenolidase n=1 Tax=Cupriavidus necator TaxID=106590 RepID=A0A1U9UP82_CUPNE|nr:dienelactone hydrolase family protein [Cupriavidus necator]AQV94453.1 carboxymethylenebutenolidase [Cupriavidus necator]
MLTRESCSTYFRHVIPMAFFVFVTSLSCVGHAQVARMEVIPFHSSTLTDEEFLDGRPGKPITIAGELRLPRPGTERFPVVVLLHGTAGITSTVTDWEQDLLAMGVATFVVDSYTGRGFVSTINDMSTLGRLVQIGDAYRALEALQKHPRIDPERVMLMGLSWGGHAALYASLKRFQRMRGPASGREFSAYVAFYPPCNIGYLQDEDISAKPVRIFHGSADDYVPVVACREYVNRLRVNGKDIELTEYPGAYHGFDSKAFATPLKLQQAQTTGNCRLQEAAHGEIVNVATNKPFSYHDSCVGHGLTLAYNQEVSARVRTAVKELLPARERAKTGPD